MVRNAVTLYYSIYYVNLSVHTIQSFTQHVFNKKRYCSLKNIFMTINYTKSIHSSALRWTCNMLDLLKYISYPHHIRSYFPWVSPSLTFSQSYAVQISPHFMLAGALKWKWSSSLWVLTFPNMCWITFLTNCIWICAAWYAPDMQCEREKGKCTLIWKINWF